MTKNRKPTDLKELLDRIEESAQGDGEVSFDEVMQSIGHSSFGPFILLAGLITLAPLIGDIPGVPTVMGVFVLLTAGQLLIGRKHVWLPTWMLRRKIRRGKLRKGISWMRKPARFIDRALRPRIRFLTRPEAVYAGAAACLLVALAMPVMEFVPFSANIAGIALTAFGLAFIARDGLLALIAFVFTLGSFGVVAAMLFN